MPDYAETIKRLQAAARNEILPMPGTGQADLEDPQHLLVEGVIDRTEAQEAAEKKRKVFGSIAHTAIAVIGIILELIPSFNCEIGGISDDES